MSDLKFFIIMCAIFGPLILFVVVLGASEIYKSFKYGPDHG